jgi:hypothetical protein
MNMLVWRKQFIKHYPKYGIYNLGFGEITQGTE